MKTLDLPNRITIHDTTVREGFQREERLIPTDAKLWVVRQLVKAGFKRKAVDFTRRWLEMGADEIEHADHDGSATPDRIHAYFSAILDAMPNPEAHVAHFHSTRGWGMANVLAAMQAGITHFESTLGGIGGQPANFVDGVPVAGTGDYYHKDPGLSGLVCTEDLAVLLDGMNIETGLDVDTVISTGGMVERIVGRRLRSECLHSGRIAK